MRKVAILVLNYNLPDMTDRLVLAIKRVVKYPHDVFVIDNGSDKADPAKSTTHRTEENLRITGGFNFGLKCIRGWEALRTGHSPEIVEGVRIEEKSRRHFSPDTSDESDCPYDAVWFVCNDIRLVQPTVDPVAAMMHSVHASRSRGKPIGIIHPSMQVVPGIWNHHHMNYDPRGSYVGSRDVDWADIICPIYTREMMETLGWEFMPELIHGWGIDRYSCAEAWWHGFRVCICDSTQVWHRMGTTYDAGLDSAFKDFDEYKAAAGGSQGEVLSERYGDDYMRRFAAARAQYAAGGHR